MRHRHADLIHAWAEGAEIEVKTKAGKWIGSISPSFSSALEYRIKPTTKPDVVCYYTANVNNREVGTILMGDNLKLTFDGETGELKSAEVLK